jgi:hypothetical protein
MIFLTSLQQSRHFPTRHKRNTIYMEYVQRVQCDRWQTFELGGFSLIPIYFTRLSQWCDSSLGRLWWHGFSKPLAASIFANWRRKESWFYSFIKFSSNLKYAYSKYGIRMIILRCTYYTLFKHPNKNNTRNSMWRSKLAPQRTLLLCTWEVPSSYLNWDTDYSTCSLQSHHSDTEILPWIRRLTLPLTSFPSL